MKKVICLTLLFGFLLVSRPTYDYANTVEGVIFRVNDANDEVVSIEYLPSFETSQNIVNNAEAKPRNVWRELSPLHSTRSDVERLFGVPETSIAWAHFYKFEKEAVNFRYAKGNCNLSDFGWNVPMDTILEIDVTPLVTILLSDLDLDLPNFERVESWHPENLFYYTNLEDGVTIQTRLLDGRERVDRIKYGPSTKDLGLACPPATVAFAKRMQDKSALQAMVDTERAFAKLVGRPGHASGICVLHCRRWNSFSAPSGKRKAVVCGTSPAAIRQAPAAQLVSGSCRHGPRGRPGIHHWSVGIQTRYSRRQVGGVGSFPDGLEAPAGRVMEICD